MKRFVSVFLPQWPIERLRRAAPDSVPDDAPLILVHPCDRGLEVHACNRQALREGVREGEMLADVRARLPQIASRLAEPSMDAAALRSLARWCGRYGPALNVDGQRGLWIDVSGVAHLFGGEAGLVRDLVGRLAAFGYTACVGLGDTLGAAWALARFSGGVPLVHRIAPAGGTREALAPLTVEGLRLAPDTLVLLHRLGLKTIGQLYPLPRASLKRRLSSKDAAGDVLRRLDQALGIDNEPGRPLETPPRHAVRRAFEEPLISSEGLMTALEPLSADLCRGLDEAQRGARRLRLLLYRVDGAVLSVAAGLSAPSRTPAHIIRLIGDRLAQIDVGLGIDALVLEAPRTQIFAHAQSALVQSVLTSPHGNEEDVARLVDQLTNRLSGACVSRLKPLASHLPERAEQHVAAVEAERGKEASDAEDAEGWRRWRSAAQMPRPPLLLASPEPITVMAEIPEGPPVHFSWRRVMRRIVRAEGPERIAPEWWLEIGGAASRTRDYYRVEDEAGGRYWLFREGLYQERGEDTETPPRWYLHGLYG